MLSPGLYYQHVPRDPVENLEFRRWLMQACQESPSYRRAVIHACKVDCLFFVNVFCYQINPKPVGEHTSEIGPFITWDYQDEAIVGDNPKSPGILWCIENGSDLVIEKSRDMGASWICILVMLWLFLFHEWKKFTIVSKDRDSVDNREDPDSLFWKMRFVLGYLPKWLIGEVEEQKMLLKSHKTGSSISGVASTGKAGVGGRATAVFCDEFSLIEEAREVFSRTKDTTNCRIFNGTHYGTGGMFYDLCDPGSVYARSVKKLEMHWSKHPDKRKGLYRWDNVKQCAEVLDHDTPWPHDYVPVSDGLPAGGPYPGIRSFWYDKEYIARGGDQNKREIALHLDMDPRGSSNQFFDTLAITSLRREYAREPLGRYDIVYDDATGRPIVGQYGALVSSPRGHLQLWCQLDYKGNPPPGKYVIGGDIATGTGATPSVFAIMNERGEKIGRYFNARIEPIPLGPLMVALCWVFKSDDGQGALLVWEHNGPGFKFCERVREIGYGNIWYRPANAWANHRVIADTPGWWPSKAAKITLLNDYRHALQHRLIVNPSDEGLQTCLSYVWKPDGSVDHDRKDANPDESGARENHGDETMADALTYMLIKDKIIRPEPKVEAEKLVPYSKPWLKKYREMHEETQSEWGREEASTW
jgi:hypothetical protein